MAHIQPYMAVDGVIVPAKEATVSIASSAVLYGLSVYSVIFGKRQNDATLLFRVEDHLVRIQQSAKMIGFGSVEALTRSKAVLETIQKLNEANSSKTDQFYRIAIHAIDLLPGIKTSGLTHSVSIFSYDAQNILPQDKSKIKTSLWRRTADTAIPARAKVNGAYVNSALAKQDALDSGCDDCLFLNQNGYVSELSAANVFIVKNNTLITPDTASDILEGITRRSVIELANAMNIPVTERKVALTEMYTADEVFACGTSAFVSPITELDNRCIGDNAAGPVTIKLRDALKNIQSDSSHPWVVTI